MSASTLKKYSIPLNLDFVLGKIEEQCIKVYSSRFGEFCYVYGGFPRDILRRVQPQDMDVSVPCKEVAEAFIKSLEQSNRMIQLETRTTRDSHLSALEYKCYSMQIQTPHTPILNVDISYSMATSLKEESLKNCDFTANNLKMDRNGQISTRIKAYQIGLKMSESEWTAKCIHDCMEGKLVWMIPNRFSTNMGATDASQKAFMEKMNMRLQKMLSKGFVLTGEHLTSFRLSI